MTITKRAIVIFFLFIILFLFGGYTTLDWYQFLTGTANFARPEIPYVRATKVAVSFISAILVFLIGRDGFNRGDTKRLVFVYAAIAIGDIFLVFDINMIGMLVFAVAHVFFIIRNGWGFKGYLAHKSNINRVWDIASALLILAIAGGAMGWFLPPCDGAQPDVLPAAGLQPLPGRFPLVGMGCCEDRFYAESQCMAGRHRPDLFLCQRPAGGRSFCHRAGQLPDQCHLHHLAVLYARPGTARAERL